MRLTRGKVDDGMKHPYETMSNCSQNCWIDWNSAVLCFKRHFYVGVWTFARFVKPLLATVLCVWEIWSGSNNHVYMYNKILPNIFLFKSPSSHQHISRNRHDMSGAVVDHESYVSVLPLDYMGIKHMDSYIPALKNAPMAKCEKDMPYCGHPYYLPLLHVFR